MSYSRIIEELCSNKKIILTGHLDPDIDCVASMLALYSAFGGREKGWQMVLQDVPNVNMGFLPGVGEIITPDKINIEPESIFLVDCNSVSRVSSGWINAYLPATSVFVVDHHLMDGELTENMVIETFAAAAGEVVFHILRQAQTVIGQELALLLYAAMSSDTGGFRQSHTTSRTLFAAAELLETGLDIETIRINLFESRSKQNLSMLSEAIQSMKILCDGKAVLMFLTREIINKHGASKNDFTDIVSFALSLRGVKIGMLFEERSEELIKINMRSRKGYSVNNIAKVMGGGGHLMASGATVMGTLDTVTGKVIELIEEEIKRVETALSAKSSC